MTRANLPEDVQRFLKEYIRSVGELEVLLLLHRKHEQWWTPEAVNEELRTSLQSALECLTQLHASGLVERVDGPPVGYRLERDHAGSDTVVGRLAQLFKASLSSVIDAIYERQHDNLREFADAFRLKKKKDDKDG